MLIIAGIVPVAEIPLITGSVQMKDDSIVVDGHRIPWSQGTAAMIAAALATTDYLGLEAPRAILAGDTGAGRGSHTLYKYLIDNVAAIHPKVLALHYWMPDLELMHQLYEKVDRLQPRPILIADAASMYAAKAAGLEVVSMYLPRTVPNWLFWPMQMPSILPISPSTCSRWTVIVILNLSRPPLNLRAQHGFCW